MLCRVYKIVYQPDPTNFYVGSTKLSLQERWQDHVRTLSRPDHGSYNMPLYQFMREHSLSDFAMEELEASICADRKQQLMREQHWMDELKPTLNKIRAFLDDPTRKAQERVRRKRNEAQERVRKKRYEEENRDKIRARNANV